MTLTDIRVHLNKLTIQELQLLNRECCDMIRLQQARTARNFKVGDRVAFTARGTPYTGRVTQVNRLTVSVACDVPSGHRGLVYRVSPSALKLEPKS